MNDLKKKIRIFLLPYLCDICGVMVFNLIIYWIFGIKMKLLIKEQWVYLPIILSLIMSATWLRERLSQFDITRKRVVFITVVVVVFYSTTMILLQDYMSIKTAKLTSVKHISDAAALPDSRYYQVEEYFIDKKGAGSFKFWEENAKQKSDVTFTLYLALPIIDRASDSIDLDCSYFLLKEFKRKVKIDLTQTNGSLALRQFEKERREQLGITDLSHFTYFEVESSFFGMEYSEAAILASNYIKYRDPVIFKGHTTPFSDRTKGKLQTIFTIFFLGILVVFVNIMLIPLKRARRTETYTSETYNDRHKKLPGYSI